MWKFLILITLCLSIVSLILGVLANDSLDNVLKGLNEHEQLLEFQAKFNQDAMSFDKVSKENEDVIVQSINYINNKVNKPSWWQFKKMSEWKKTQEGKK